MFKTLSWREMKGKKVSFQSVDQWVLKIDLSEQYKRKK
jgi:hypothetical protein